MAADFMTNELMQRDNEIVKNVDKMLTESINFKQMMEQFEKCRTTDNMIKSYRRLYQYDSNTWRTNKEAMKEGQ